MSYENVIDVVFLIIMFGLGILCGINVGRSYQQESDITKYCIHQEYQGSTKIDNEYYCYDGDSLFKVEWVE